MSDYSHKIMDPNLFAPAVTQSFASLAMEASKIGGGAHLCRKTRAFLSFQTVHDTSIVIEAIAFLSGTPVPVKFSHQLLTEASKCHEEVSKCVS